MRQAATLGPAAAAAASPPTFSATLNWWPGRAVHAHPLVRAALKHVTPTIRPGHPVPCHVLFEHVLLHGILRERYPDLPGCPTAKMQFEVVNLVVDANQKDGRRVDTFLYMDTNVSFTQSSHDLTFPH